MLYTRRAAVKEAELSPIYPARPMTSPSQDTEPLPLTEAQKAELYARQIREHLETARQLAATAAQLALHHQHSEAARRYVQLGRQLEFAERIRGHGEMADLRGYFPANG